MPAEYLIAVSQSYRRAGLIFGIRPCAQFLHAALHLLSRSHWASERAIGKLIGRLLMGRKGSRRCFADYEVRVSSRPLSCDAPRERHSLAHIGHRTPTG